MSYRFSSTNEAPRADTTTNYVDWWQVRVGALTLISLFGYNSGAQQWIQLFDAAVSPTIAITDTDDSTDIFTAASHGLNTGQRVQVSGISGITDATICYVRKVSVSTFSLYDTLAHAMDSSSTTGRLNPDTPSDTGTITLVPIHTFAIGATDNYSCIISVTGVEFSKGLIAAVSSTGPLYTAGAAKNVTMLGTLKA